MAGIAKEPIIYETNEDPDPDAEEKMIPGTSQISTKTFKPKRKSRKKSKQSKRSKKSKKSNGQGKKQIKITKFLANKKKVAEPEQSDEIATNKPESVADDEDLIKNTGIIKSKNMKNKKKKSKQIAAFESSSEEEEASKKKKKSISEFDKIQQQLAKIGLLRAEFSKGPDISEIITDMKKAEDQQNESMQTENGSDEDEDCKIDFKKYFFQQSHHRRIRNCLRNLPKLEDFQCTTTDFLQLLGSVQGTENQNDPFNIGKLLFDEKIIDNGELMLLLKCCFTFNKLIETFTANAVEDGVLVAGKEPPPEKVDHHHQYVNDAQILKKYVNLYSINAKKLMIDDPTGDENLQTESGSRFRGIPLFIYCLLAQEICLKTLKYTTNTNKKNKKKKNLKEEDRSRFIIDLLNTFPTIPNYASMMMVLFGDNPVKQTKRNKCLLVAQLSAILIIGLFDAFQYFDQDIDKFFQLLELMVTLQSRMLDCLTNGVESIQVMDQHPPSFQSHDDDEDGEDDAHNEYDQTLSVYLFLLHICLTLKTFYHAKDKFCLVNNNETDQQSNGPINSVQRSFIVYDHLKSMFSKLFQTFNGYNTKRVFQKFYQLVLRWHTFETFEMHPNMESLKEDKICIQLIIIIETFSQLMLFLPSRLSKTGEHLHLFWMLFTLIKLKCKPTGSGTESDTTTSPVGYESVTICCTFEQAIQPMIDIVWRELPFGCQTYLVHFISAYITNFGTNPFILNLCKTLFNIPGMDFKFRSMISALSMDV